MIPDFGTKHLTGLAWLLSLIVVVLAILLVIRKNAILVKSSTRR